jgi:hypothetical protein
MRPTVLLGTVILEYASTHKCHIPQDILLFVLIELWVLTYPDGVMETTHVPLLGLVLNFEGGMWLLSTLTIAKSLSHTALEARFRI